MTHIDKVGIEFEGKADSVPKDMKYKTDSSVNGFRLNELEEDHDCNNLVSICDNCDEECQYCECDSCSYCANCDNQENDCTCRIGESDIITNCHEFDNYHTRCNCNVRDSHYIGEFVTDPIKLYQQKEIFNQIDSVGYETNKSCGLHKHFSFKSKGDYSKLMTQDFYTYFLERISSWAKSHNVKGEFWKRLNGDNTFCHRGLNARNQLMMTTHYESARYYHLNFGYNVDNRQTMEVRLLPAFKMSSLRKSALLELDSIIEDYLDSNDSNEWNRNSFELVTRVDYD